MIKNIWFRHFTPKTNKPNGLYLMNRIHSMDSAPVKWKNYSLVFDRRKRGIDAPFEEGSTVPHGNESCRK